MPLTRFEMLATDSVAWVDVVSVFRMVTPLQEGGRGYARIQSRRSVLTDTLTPARILAELIY